MNIYLASPFFSNEQIEREERIKKHLRNLGLNVFSPKEESLITKESTIFDREQTFLSNIKHIQHCDIVFAITDTKDVGTIWECGYAYGINKPVVFYAETLADKPFNLMLAQSGINVITKQSDITIENLKTEETYLGSIE